MTPVSHFTYLLSALSILNILIYLLSVMLAVRPTVRGRNCSSSPILPYAFNQNHDLRQHNRGYFLIKFDEIFAHKRVVLQ
jgi:hypothetical protein